MNLRCIVTDIFLLATIVEQAHLKLRYVFLVSFINYVFWSRDRKRVENLRECQY